MTSDVEENSRTGIKTRDGHAFALKGYSSLYSITTAVTAAYKPASPTRTPITTTTTQRKALQKKEEALQKWSPQKCPTALTAAVDRGRKQH